ncbi:MAG: argininosuccinate lyase [Bacillota bacterium]
MRSRVYVDTVLLPGFELAKKRFFRPMVEVSIAHVLMLAKEGIVAKDEAAAAIRAWKQVLADGVDQVEYDPRYEDLFFYLEARIEQIAGSDAAGSMHVAMSRNDMDAAMFRMALRNDILHILGLLGELRESILDLAASNVDTVMIAYTHNQQAQPTTLGHYLAGVESHLARGFERGYALLKHTNRSPLGAAALAGTGFPIDREFVAGLLGFEELVENTYEAVAASDHFLEAAAFIEVDLSSLSRFVTDLMILSMNEVSGITLDEGLVQISSIMPQKRNPVALEHVRTMISRTMNQAQSVFWLAHNCPFGDVQDVGDEMQVAVVRLTEDAIQTLRLACEVIANIRVNKDVLTRNVRTGFLTSTELADVLVRSHGFKFRAAHKVVAEFVNELRSRGLALAAGTAQGLDAVSLRVGGRATGMTQEEYTRAIDPAQFVELRSVRGGPAPGELTRQLLSARDRLRLNSDMLKALQNRLQQANERLWNTAEEFIRPSIDRNGEAS